jgi:hypothetical protein
MNLHPCQFAIVRFLPYAETGEFANVGVVLACPAKGYFGFRLMPTKKTARIRGFFEQLDVSIYRNALGYMRDELDRLTVLAAQTLERDAVRQLFLGLVHPRETVVRFSDVRAVMAADPAQMLEKLFSRFVERDFVGKDYNDRLVERSVRELLSKAALRALFSEADIGNEDLHLTVPFAYKREGRVQLAIKPIDLAKDEASKVFDTGGRLVDRVNRLGKHALLPPQLMVAVRAPLEMDLRVSAAVEEIESDLRLVGVRVTRADDVETITRFARGAASLN